MPQAQVQYLCSDSASTVLFVEDDEQLDKALSVRDAAAAPAQDHRHGHGRPCMTLSDPQVLGLDALIDTRPRP